MSLRRTPRHIRPLPARVDSYPFIGLFATPDGANQLIKLQSDASISDLFDDRPLRLLNLETFGSMLAVDRGEDADLPLHPRAEAAVVATWTAVHGWGFEQAQEIRKLAIRGPVLFVGFAFGKPPAWYKRRTDQKGLADEEALSVEHLLADPEGWIEHNGLPF